MLPSSRTPQCKPCSTSTPSRSLAALRHTCPVKISLTLPAGVVLPVKSLNFISNNDVLGRVVHSDNCCVNCVHYGANKKSRSKDLSGLASTSAHQLLASSCLGRPAQMSGAPSTSSLEVLKDQCVQGAVLRGKFRKIQSSSYQH